jgi:antitoxin component YwqK of YwqJK toxin-antitoxin module
MMQEIKLTALISVILFLFSPALLTGQQKSTGPKVKTIVVWQEKFNTLVARKVKESETTYDIRGNILEDIQYIEGKVDKHFQYQYDLADNKIKEIEFTPAGKVDQTSEYKFENGLRTEKKVFDSAGKLKSKKTYIYTTF